MGLFSIFGKKNNKGNKVQKQAEETNNREENVNMGNNPPKTTEKKEKNIGPKLVMLLGLLTVFFGLRKCHGDPPKTVARPKGTAEIGYTIEDLEVGNVEIPKGSTVVRSNNFLAVATMKGEAFQTYTFKGKKENQITESTEFYGTTIANDDTYVKGETGWVEHKIEKGTELTVLPYGGSTYNQMVFDYTSGTDGYIDNDDSLKTENKLFNLDDLCLVMSESGNVYKTEFAGKNNQADIVLPEQIFIPVIVGDDPNFATYLEKTDVPAYDYHIEMKDTMSILVVTDKGLQQVTYEEYMENFSQQGEKGKDGDCFTLGIVKEDTDFKNGILSTYQAEKGDLVVGLKDGKRPVLVSQQDGRLSYPTRDMVEEICAKKSIGKVSENGAMLLDYEGDPYRDENGNIIFMYPMSIVEFFDDGESNIVEIYDRETGIQGYLSRDDITDIEEKKYYAKVEDGKPAEAEMYMDIYKNPWVKIGDCYEGDPTIQFNKDDIVKYLEIEGSKITITIDEEGLEKLTGDTEESKMTSEGENKFKEMLAVDPSTIKPVNILQCPGGITPTVNSSEQRTV